MEPHSTSPEIVDAGKIHEDMFAMTIEADVVVCGITVHNANVFCELEESTPELVWAKISQADVLFLTDDQCKVRDVKA